MKRVGRRVGDVLPAYTSSRRRHGQPTGNATLPRAAASLLQAFESTFSHDNSIKKARGKGASPRPACGMAPRVSGSHRSARDELFGLCYGGARVNAPQLACALLRDENASSPLDARASGVRNG